MILVTGGTGLVGSHLLHHLLLNGEKVRALRRNSSSLEELNKLFGYYEASNLLNNIEWIEGDVLDYYSMLDSLEGVDKVYHCAAMVSFSAADRKMMYQINVEGTANVVNACIAMSVEKMCFVSSIATLGKNIDGSEIDEEVYWQSDDAHSIYSQTKYQAEMEVWRGTKEGLDAVIVNPSVIIGPCSPKRSSGLLLARVAKGMSFYTSGSTGFVDVRDVVMIMAKLMDGSIVNERFILNGENLSYEMFFKEVAKGLGVAEPSKKASPMLTEIAWRIEGVKCFFTRQNPRLTRELARTSQSKSDYSSNKVEKRISITFTPIKEAIYSAIRYSNL